MGQVRARMETESQRLTHVFQPGSHVRRAKGLVLCVPSGHTQSTWWEQQDGESLPREMFLPTVQQFSGCFQNKEAPDETGLEVPWGSSTD